MYACVCVCMCTYVYACVCACVMHNMYLFHKQSRLTRLGEVRGTGQDGRQQYGPQCSRQWSQVCNDCCFLSNSSHQYVG